MNTDLDAIAVGAHPDDVEIGCGGIVAKLVEQGYRVGIVDLTDGEPTPGSTGREQRLAEANRAAQALGAAVRVTLELPNRRLFDCFEARVALAKEFRRHRPRLVLGLGASTPLASPDHYQAYLITEAAFFYSRLTKWDEEFGGLPPHHPAVLLYYFLAHRTLSPVRSDGLVVDVTSVMEKKLSAIDCYESQFGHRPEVLERFRMFNQQQGAAAGFVAGEVVANSATWGTRDLMGQLFPPPNKEIPPQ